MDNNVVTATCGVVIFNQQGQVLLVEQREGSNEVTGVFGLPGGKVLQGEDMFDAVIREVKEETGLDIKKEDLTKLPTAYQGVIEQKVGTREFWWDVCVTESYSGTLKESHETRPQWVTINSIERLPLLPNIVNAITEARRLNMSQ